MLPSIQGAENSEQPPPSAEEPGAVASPSITLEQKQQIRARLNPDEKISDTQFAGETDKPVAGLLSDLEQRGLLNDTLVIRGGEFGRLPLAQKSAKPGRDHNPHAFTYWFAGGGTKGGTSYGATDEFGHKAVENRVNIHDLHATVLNLLGMNHKNLTYRHNGRDFRLTDVEGKVIQEIIA